MIVVKVITIDDDLQRFVEEINSASWDDANGMSEFDVEALTAYLLRKIRCLLPVTKGMMQAGRYSASLPREWRSSPTIKNVGFT
jgi:hypothetical protein